MDTPDSKSESCYWTHRYEVLGVILVIIATFLTIVSLSSAGIFMLFLAGLVFCFHRYYAIALCCHRDHTVIEPGDLTPVKTPRAARTVHKHTL